MASLHIYIYQWLPTAALFVSIQCRLQLHENKMKSLAFATVLALLFLALMKVSFQQSDG